MGVITRYRSEDGTFYGNVESFSVIPWKGWEYAIVADSKQNIQDEKPRLMAICYNKADAIKKLDRIQSLDGLAAQIDLRDWKRERTLDNPKTLQVTVKADTEALEKAFKQYETKLNRLLNHQKHN